jgi:aldose 1-epimerase
VTDEVVRWEDDDIAVEALPGIGGRLHRVRAFGVDLLRTPTTPAVHRDDPFFWGAYPLAPWCNRATTEPIELAGRRVELPTNFPDGTAIHGQVYAAVWDVVDESTLRVEAGGGSSSEPDRQAGGGWPWRYDVHARFRVAPGSFGLTLELRNRDDAPMPAGVGIHPWFAKPVRIAVPAARVFTDNMAPPTDPQAVEPPFDLRRLDAMADGLDATWSDLSGHAIELAWPEHGLEATFGFSEAATFVVAASPADVDAIAVEPQTHALPGLRRLLEHEPGALTMLAPGEVLAVDYELRFRRV